jgi:hypothetical protein
MKRGDLTFDTVDDLLAAHARGKLSTSPNAQFAPRRIGPLIELAFGAGCGGRYGPLLESPWLDRMTQADLRSALRGASDVWLDELQHRGLLRTLFNPSNAREDPARTQFLMAARKTAEAVGFARATAQSLAAAIRELESNVHEHSGKPATGIIAFQARSCDFEFVVADGGVGVLATLRQAPEFRQLARSWTGVACRPAGRRVSLWSEGGSR